LKYSQPTSLATYRPPRDGNNIFEEAGLNLNHLKNMPHMDFPVMKFRRKDALHYSHPIPIEVDPAADTGKISVPAKITSPTDPVQSLPVPTGIGGVNGMPVTMPNLTQPPLRDRQPPQNIPSQVRVSRSRVESVPPAEPKPMTPQNGTTPGYPYVTLPPSVRETNGSNPNNVRRSREVVGVTPISWNNNNNRSFHNNNNNNMF